MKKNIQETQINLIIEGVKNHLLSDLKKLITSTKAEDYLSRNQVAKMLEISLSTLWLWTKKGTLKSYQIEGRTYYKRSEVENAFVELKN